MIIKRWIYYYKSPLWIFNFQLSYLTPRRRRALHCNHSGWFDGGSDHLPVEQRTCYETVEDTGYDERHYVEHHQIGKVVQQVLVPGPLEVAESRVGEPSDLKWFGSG